MRYGFGRGEFWSRVPCESVARVLCVVFCQDLSTMEDCSWCVAVGVLVASDYVATFKRLARHKTNTHKCDTHEKHLLWPLLRTNVQLLTEILPEPVVLDRRLVRARELRPRWTRLLLNAAVLASCRWRVPGAQSVMCNYRGPSCGCPALCNSWAVAVCVVSASSHISFCANSVGFWWHFEFPPSFLPLSSIPST